MKFTASVAALILLRGSAIALPLEPGVLAIGDNRLPSPYPEVKAPQRGPGSCGKPDRPSSVGPGVPKPSAKPDTEPDTEPGGEPGTQPGFQPGFQPGIQPGTKPGTQPGIPQPGDNPPKPQPTSDAGGQVPGPEVDDYPYKGQCDQIDENQQTTCQCTSFAAWRVVNRLHADFNGYARQGWGNANQWANVARNAGLVVDNTPAPGAIAQTTAGPYGHVAWVHDVDVDGNEVEIEDYNGAGGDRRYGRGKRSADEFQYIHFQ
ncbi:choline binding protein D [Metarhizium acridum CQMa 102]|uniref:Choline binding protein D n=1 Tax=Metarhizium acridum (strain CQMa 102) TaxID=655827 RepID=E9DZB5_METAQ|nr:choline binding protein D [Metarhizium acridum CQMa 102]EFY91077.1 choline binding protein D [Metarhizium acridum CQMa 102]